MIKLLKLFSALLCTLFSAHALASYIDIVGLSVGPTWGSGNKTQTFYLQPDILKSYVAESNTHTFTTAEIFVAQQKEISEKYLGQLGISLQGAGNARLSGDILEDASPDFNNANYSYKLNHAYVAAKARVIKTDVSNQYLILPYASGSLGVGFNHAYYFRNIPKITEEVATPNFKNQTKTSFSYTFGLGLQKAIIPQIQAAIGYEFADWGRSKLARANNQTLNQGLSLKHFYAQQLQFSLFYTPKEMSHAIEK
ncbi:MAG: porin family protein [Legionella sp.]|nr:porin family protein [Legionella sp.]